MDNSEFIIGTDICKQEHRVLSPLKYCVDLIFLIFIYFLLLSSCYLLSVTLGATTCMCFVMKGQTHPSSHPLQHSKRLCVHFATQGVCKMCKNENTLQTDRPANPSDRASFKPTPKATLVFLFPEVKRNPST